MYRRVAAELLDQTINPVLSFAAAAVALDAQYCEPVLDVGEDGGSALRHGTD